MIFNLILLLVSFVFLYYGAGWLINGASAVAKSLNLSKVVVGVTLVAFGTSAPELFVNLIAACRGHSGIALSNVSGSNLANLCLGYGICACFGTIVIDKKKFRLDLIYFCLAPLLVLLFLLIPPRNQIPLWGAAIFITSLVLYIMSMKSRLYEEQSEQSEDSRSGLYKGLFIFLMGTVALYLSGEMIVRSAVGISEYFGISETTIGLTVIAIGTSLPDITASLIAVKKGETSIAVGNLLGSNIFNVLLVLPGSLLVSRAAFVTDWVVTADYSMVFLASAIFVATLFWRQKVGYIRAAVLLITYIAYMLSRMLFLN